MKYFCVFALLIGSISATVLTPEQASVNERFIDGIIIDMIESLSQSIKDWGLDPLQINREAGQFALPVPELFTAHGYVEKFFMRGLSNIKVNSLTFSLLSLRLNYDLEMPGIHVSIGRAYGEVSGFGDKGDGTISGSVDIGTIRVVGHAQVSIGIISGISVSELSIDMTLAGINSNLNTVQIFKYDITDFVNKVIGTTIPETLDNMRLEMNELLEYYMLAIIERVLDDILLAQYLI